MMYLLYPLSSLHHIFLTLLKYSLRILSLVSEPLHEIFSSTPKYLYVISSFIGWILGSYQVFLPYSFAFYVLLLNKHTMTLQISFKCFVKMLSLDQIEFSQCSYLWLITSYRQQRTDVSCLGFDFHFFQMHILSVC